jgi:flagellar biosynthesis protein FliR
MVPLLAPEITSSAALLLMRMTGLVMAAPVLSARSVPMTMRATFALVFTVLLLPAAVPANPEDAVRVTAAALTGEFTVGLLLGLGASVLLGAAEAAGDLMAVQVGLSGANVLSPSAETQVPIVGQVMGLMVLTAMVTTGAHVVLIQILALSLDLAPAGQLAGLAEGLSEAVGIGARLLGVGLLLSSPVVAVSLVGNVALGILSRAVPQLQVLQIAFPVQIALGLIVLGSTVPLLGPLLSLWADDYAGWAVPLLELIGPEGR